MPTRSSVLCCLDHGDDDDDDDDGDGGADDEAHLGGARLAVRSGHKEGKEREGGRTFMSFHLMELRRAYVRHGESAAGQGDVPHILRGAVSKGSVGKEGKGDVPCGPGLRPGGSPVRTRRGCLCSCVSAVHQQRSPPQRRRRKRPRRGRKTHRSCLAMSLSAPRVLLLW